MKKFLIIIGVGVFILMVVILANQPNKTESNAVDDSIKISNQIKSVNGQLIDVREPSEYAASHADNAVNIPLGIIEKGDFTGIDSTKPIYLYCRTGRRSALAKTALEKAGYKNIVDIGGLIDWQNDGNKVCSSTIPACS